MPRRSNTAPSPLPASSPKLRSHRYHVWVGGEKKPTGGRPMIAEGRFVSLDDAKAWADENYPDAPVVTVTSYAAYRGWRSRRVSARIDGTWG